MEHVCNLCGPAWEYGPCGKIEMEGCLVAQRNKDTAELASQLRAALTEGSQNA